MRAKPYLIWILVPVIAYLLVLLVAALVVKPSPLGWVGFGVASLIGLVIAALAFLLYPHTRANTLRLHPRTGGTFSLLVVADSRCGSAGVCSTVRDHLRGRVADVLVIVPVLASALHFLTEDEEAERDEARVRLADLLLGLKRLGIEARGTVGADDPVQAIGDALATFPANEIVIAAPPQRSRHWLEQDLERTARDVFGIHVSTLAIDVDVSTTRP